MLLADELRSLVQFQNPSTNATQVKQWRSLSLLTHQKSFDQILTDLLQVTGWIEKGRLTDVMNNFSRFVAGNSEGEDTPLVGTQAMFSNILDSLINGNETQLYPINEKKID